MYSIHKRTYGFLLAFGGTITADEMKHFRVESVRELVGIRGKFGLIIDLREFHSDQVDAEAREEMQDGIELYRKAGAYRSCLVLSSGALTGQYRRRARESRTKFFERYINAENDPKWLSKAVAWVDQGTEPEN